MPENPTPSGLLQPDAANNGNAGAGAIDALSLFRRLSSATVATSFQPSQRDQFGGQIYNRSNTNLANLATQLGYSAIGSGNRSTAVGSFAYAREDSAVALGVYALALGPSSVAIGDQALSSGYRSITIGNQGQGNALGAISIGFQARALGVNSIAIGSQAYAIGANAISIGASARTVAAYSMALGALASVPVSNSPGALAIGANANVTGAFGAAIALGAGATVLGTLSPAIAIGSNATVTSPGREGIAIGTNALVSARGAQAYGEATTASFTDSVAFGRATITTSTNQMMVGNPTYPLSVNISGTTPWVDVIAYGAKGDGTTNDTTAIQNAITALAAFGGGTVFVPIGTYKLTSALTMTSTKVNLVGAGRESSILYWSANGVDGLNITSGFRSAHLSIRGPSSVTIPGFSGIDTGGITDVEIIDCIVEEWGSHGINTGGSSSRWVIRDCIIRNNHADDGILVGGGSSQIAIVNNWIYSNGAWGVDLNGSNNIVDGNYIYLNGVEQGGTDSGGIAIYAYVTGSTTYHANSNSVTKNVVFQNTGEQIWLLGSSTATANYNRIIGNEFNQGNQHGIKLGGGDGAQVGTKIHANVMNSNSAGRGLFLQQSTGTISQTEATNNRCTGNDYGIVVEAGCIDTQLRDNVCLANITDQIFDQGTRTTHAGNKITTSDGYYRVLSTESLTGDLRLETAGNGVLVKRGTNATFGVVTLSGAGTAIVYSTKITTSGSIFLAGMNASGTAGAVYISTSTNLVSATVASTNAADTRDVHWWIVNPA